MGWLEVMRRDPVPWLLDPVNPSVRLLTLQGIFRKPLAALQGEQQALLAWKPVRDILHQFSPENLWGWRENPYHGSMVGTFGTLFLLAQLGLPRTEESALACENLLHYGRTLEGRFKPPELADSMWVCYTGMALQALWHFGYGDDPQVRATLDMVEQSLAQGVETLTCAATGGPCQWGLTKLLGALLAVPPAQRSPRLSLALERLIEYLLTFPYDFDRRDVPWLQPTFPRYYDSDLVELAFLVSQTDYRLHPAFLKLLGRMTALQNAEGRWPKLRRTFVFVVEKVNEPSRWLTLQAVQALMRTYGGNDYGAG